MVGKVIAHLKIGSSEENSDEEDLLNDSLGLYVAVADLKKLVIISVFCKISRYWWLNY